MVHVVSIFICILCFISTDLISVTVPGGCRSQGCHGFAPRLAHFFCGTTGLSGTNPQAHPLTMSLTTSVAYSCPDSHNEQQTRNKYEDCDLQTNLVMQHYQTDTCKLGNVNRITCLMYKVNLVFELFSLDLVWGRW